MGVLAVAMLTLMLLFGRGLQLSSQAEERTRAAEIAREFLEAVKAQGGYRQVVPDAVYDGRAGDPPSGDFPPPPYPKVTLEGHDYHLVVRTANESLRVRALAVEVWWKEGGRVILETAFSL